MLAKELLIVESLRRLIVDAADRVTVRQHHVAISVGVRLEHRGFAQTPSLQEQLATSNFRIFFFTTEASQKGHDTMARWNVKPGRQRIQWLS